MLRNYVGNMVVQNSRITFFWSQGFAGRVAEVAGLSILVAFTIYGIIVDDWLAASVGLMATLAGLVVPMALRTHASRQELETAHRTKQGNEPPAIPRHESQPLYRKLNSQLTKALPSIVAVIASLLIVVGITAGFVTGTLSVVLDYVAGAAPFFAVAFIARGRNGSWW